MFILFGLDKQTRHDYGPTVPVVCPRCHNPTHLRLVEIKKWFTLFFVPLFPCEWTYRLECEICSRGVELNDEQFERAKRVCRAARAWREQRISEEKYNAILKRSRLLEYTTRDSAPNRNKD
jgi:hypothetical protein